MLVEVLKENYVLVLSEDRKDEQWLDKAGYLSIGEDYYQELFTSVDDLVIEVEYLMDYGATFDDKVDDENSPYKIVEDLKAEGFIK